MNQPSLGCTKERLVLTLANVKRYSCFLTILLCSVTFFPIQIAKLLLDIGFPDASEIVGSG